MWAVLVHFLQIHSSAIELRLNDSIHKVKLQILLT